MQMLPAIVTKTVDDQTVPFPTVSEKTKATRNAGEAWVPALCPWRLASLCPCHALPYNLQ